MLEYVDGVLLARIQFAFVVSFHIVFPAFTIGLSAWLAVLEWRYLKTGDARYAEIYKQWIKIFAVAFGLGVVSGVVMSYQFGTNWAVFSDKIGNVLGPLLAYEVLTAFFLEASFLGIMLFGWGRVSRRMHFAATLIVAIGTTISAFWILSANSWMQTPQGFTLGSDGLFYPENWFDIIFNPSFPYRYSHMLLAAFLCTAFAVGGVASYYLVRRKYVPHARIMLGMATLMAVCVAPLQLFVGDMHGLNTLEHQPYKVAAMEGIWEDERGAGLRLFAIPNQQEQRNDFEIAVPKLASLILTHDADGEIKGLKNLAPDDQPQVIIVFWAFRIMVGIGMLMILMGVLGAFLFVRKKLFETQWYLRMFMCMTPMGFIALLAGWFVTEVGRQPYTVYGILRTSDSVSPVVTEQVAATLLGFILTYTFIFGAGVYYIIKLIRKGPQPYTDNENYYDHTRTETYAKGLIETFEHSDHSEQQGRDNGKQGDHS